MLEDMRKKGQTHRSQAGPSSQEADRHPNTAQAPFKRLGPAKPSQKRAGQIQWQQLDLELPATQLAVVCLAARRCAVRTKQCCMQDPQELLKGSDLMTWHACELSSKDCMLISLASPQLPICCVAYAHQAQQLQVMSRSLIAMTIPSKAFNKGTKRLDQCIEHRTSFHFPGTGAPFKPPYQKAKNPEPEEGEVSAKSLEMLAGRNSIC